MRISDWSSDVCSSDLVAVLAFAGFAVHYFLPQRFRLPFFAGLSVVAVLFVFGLADGAWLLGFGLLLLGICHLPFSLWLRIGLLVGAGLFAAAARIEWIPGPWSQAIWPILARKSTRLNSSH